MPTLLELPALDAPSGPQRLTRHPVAVDDAGRVAAFVFDLDALFDAPAFDRALARAAGRALARARGLDPLWTEVLALEIARADGADAAIESLRVLGREPDLRAALAPELLRALEPVEGAPHALRSLRTRFKLAVVTRRPAEVAHAIVQALGLERTFDVQVFGGAGDDADGRCVRAVLALEERPDTCVLVGRPAGALLREAARLGMRTVALAPAGGAAAAATAADLVVSSFALVESLARGADSKYGVLPPRPTLH